MVRQARPAELPPEAPAAASGVYGTRAWLERLYEGCQGHDPWAHDLRATQKRRYHVSLNCLPPGALRSGRVLDLGCALGHFTEKLTGRGAQVIGADLVWQALARARRRLGGAPLVAAALPSLPFASHSFDLICALEVLFYLPASARGAALAELERVLKPGGRLLISCAVGAAPYLGAGELAALVSRRFAVVATAAVSGNAYLEIEERLAYTLRQLRRLATALNGNPGAVEGLGRRARRAGRAIERLGRLPALCALLRGLLAAAGRLLALVLSWEWPLRMASRLAPSRGAAGRASHVIVLAEPH